MRLWKLAVALAVFCRVSSAFAQQLAFPEAEGFGQFATGGRTTLGSASIYHVTNLSDDGAGSFRDAVSGSNRFVVFDVGGVIKLDSVVSVKSNITIAGQTAPGGIAIYGQKVSFTDANNLVSRHIAVRKGSASGRDDAASLARGTNMIFDHMSVTWGVDETFSMNPSTGATIDKISIQNSIVGQGLDVVGHSAGGLIQPNGGASLLRNLFIDNNTRNPKVKGVNQFVNNVVYNWGTAAYILGGDSEGDSFANVEGNVFIKGPTGGSSPFSGANENFHLYANENYYDGDRDGNLDVALAANKITSYGPVTTHTTPFNYPAVATVTPTAAYQHVVARVGPYITRDVVDTRMITELTSLGTIGQIVVREADLFPGYGNTPQILRGRLTDSDNDGMPDNWEVARGLNPALATDWKGLRNGYTRLEEYLNELGGDGAARISTVIGSTWSAGSTWNSTSPTLADEVFVRGNGSETSGSLTVSQGGASARRLFVGGNGAAAGEKLTVTTGGTLDVFDTLHIGYENNGVLEITGGTVTAGRVLLSIAREMPESSRFYRRRGRPGRLRAER